jgi:hypothetical protein
MGKEPASVPMPATLIALGHTGVIHPLSAVTVDPAHARGVIRRTQP